MTAYILWGLLPLYLIWLISVPSLEVLAHRIVWAVPFGALIITARGQWAQVKTAMTDKHSIAFLTLAAAMIAVNWVIYIWAVQHQKVFQASLGYYINPLMFVVIGVFFFEEYLRKLQILAVALAVLGVAILTISGGVFPYISLALATSFTTYSVIRKKIHVGAMPGLFIETLVLFPIALCWLLLTGLNGQSTFVLADLDMQLLLILAGPITVVPLLCFAIAAKKLRMATIGFMQFIAPSIQFLIGYLYGETLTTPHLVCFLFIWAAVIAFSTDAVRASRASRRRLKPEPAV